MVYGNYVKRWKNSRYFVAGCRSHLGLRIKTSLYKSYRRYINCIKLNLCFKILVKDSKRHETKEELCEDHQTCWFEFIVVFC